MWAANAPSVCSKSIPILNNCRWSSFQLSLLTNFKSLEFHMENSSSCRPQLYCNKGRGSRRGGRSFHAGGGDYSYDRIDSLRRNMVWILRHMASKFKLNVRSDGYVKVQDLLKLNLKAIAVPLISYTIDDVREAVKTDSLLKPIVSAEKISVCVHGTYMEHLNSILEHGLKRMKRLHIHFSCGLPKDGSVISGMRDNINVLIFLDVKKALEEGMKLYISENKVILTEGFNGVVPVKYFEKIESWPSRQPLDMGKYKDLASGFSNLKIK